MRRQGAMRRQGMCRQNASSGGPGVIANVSSQCVVSVSAKNHTQAAGALYIHIYIDIYTHIYIYIYIYIYTHMYYFTYVYIELMYNAVITHFHFL